MQNRFQCFDFPCVGKFGDSGNYEPERYFELFRCHSSSWVVMSSEGTMRFNRKKDALSYISKVLRG